LAIQDSGETTIRAGDTISVAIENTGGVDTTYTTVKLSLTDGKGIPIYEGKCRGCGSCGERKALVDIPIPGQQKSANLFLTIRLKDSKTEKLRVFTRP